MRTVLFLALDVVAFLLVFAWIAIERGRGQSAKPTWFQTAIGFVTNFFDTLGIGSFAPTTSIYKMGRVIPDELIPGTLNVGHSPPVIIQAFIFIAIIQVDLTTLVALIAAAVAGAWFGAGIVSRWPRRRIQIGMGIALLIAAASFVLAIYDALPVGGDALSLHGASLGFAVAAFVVFGSLMTLGIGIYAPSMITVGLLGMNPVAAFPIMMGASAFLMPVASIRFLRANRYSLPASIGLAVGGFPAVLIAAFIVKSLPLNAMRWLVVVVVVYAAIAMLRSAYTEPHQDSTPEVGDVSPAT